MSEDTFRIHRERRRVVGDIRPNKRQRQEAANSTPRQEEPVFRLQWDEHEVWHTTTRDYRVAEMDDALLWQTVIWCVRNVSRLFKDAGVEGDPRLTPALKAACWLADRPIFRALVREAIRRHLTYPSDVFTFFRAYLLHDEGALHNYQPWRDPEHAAQAEALQSLADMPPHPPAWDLGKPLRAIDLE
jgi:hypothetical protein